MGKTQVISSRLENHIVEAIKRHPDFDGNISNFVTEIILEKLGKQTSIKSGMVEMIKKVNTLETKTIEQKVVDVEIGNQLIYEELKKQNELLKIIHSRTSVAASFAKLSINELKRDEDFGKSKEAVWGELIDKEFESTQLLIRRK